MFGEAAALCTLGAAAFKVAEIATGEKRKRDEAMIDRAVERRLNGESDNSNDEDQ